MKTIQQIRILALLIVMTVGVASCNKEELPGTPDATRSPMSISVIDGGYTSGDKSHTRATENGYITEFTAGDKIGFYIVKPDGKYAVQNVCLTLTKVDDILKWQAPVGTTLYYEGVTAKYFAYYPYQQTVSGPLHPSASTAANFFADVVTKWTPTADQSTYAKYTASDLMTGIGTLGGKQADGTVSLSFAMVHAMALMVIETPSAKYSLSTNNSYTWIAEAPDTKFYDFTPYNTSVGVYRHLVKPDQSGAADLMGSYTDANSKTQEYALAQNGIASANYAYYKVDGGSATIVATKTHILQVCDFFMKNGSLVGKNATLTEAQKTACAGIVYQKSADGKGGMVVGKNEVKLAWSTEEIVTGATSTTDGVANMATIRTINPDLSKYPAFKWCADQGTGWYLPAFEDLSALNGGRDADHTTFDTNLTICGGAGIFEDTYWASSENDAGSSWSRSFVNGVKYSNAKVGGKRVRYVRAF